MKRYEDAREESGVSAYEIRSKSIAVRFKSGDVYLYDYESAGRICIEEMKRLAVAGRGLATYISQHVKKNYAAKIG